MVISYSSISHIRIPPIWCFKSTNYYTSKIGNDSICRTLNFKPKIPPPPLLSRDKNIIAASKMRNNLWYK